MVAGINGAQTLERRPAVRWIVWLPRALAVHRRGALALCIGRCEWGRLDGGALGKVSRLDALLVGGRFFEALDEDFGNGHVRWRAHAGGSSSGYGGAEFLGPVERVEEAYDDVPTHGFFYALETGAATKEFL